MSTAIPLKANKKLIPYITSLSRAGQEEISGQCATFRYTKSPAGQGTQEQKVPSVEAAAQQSEVAFAEHRLSEERSRTLVLDDIRRFLRARSEVSDGLQGFYSRTMTVHVPQAFVF
ncbi:hypothetical protein BX666DRAFT_2024853 [Dichotomocladium elegans]|nr:hypothetical protein BX666DRAFT_2024853 [Dichotomocladium elegans]